MIDRTQLTEARLFLLREVPDPDGSLTDALADLIDDGALVPLDFPTDEMVEAAARHYHAEVGRRSGVDMAWETSYDSEQADFLRVTSDALEAVRRVMYGEDA